MKIERKQIVAEFENKGGLLALAVNETLTWVEWDELSKAIEDTRRTKITQGWTVAGDILPNGLVAVSHGACIGTSIEYVMRRLPTGYEPVYDGRVMKGDLTWDVATRKYIPVPDIEIEDQCLIPTYYSVVRRPG
jgi:hypothetical protein